MTDNKPIILYHQIERNIACDDGWGAAFIAMLYFGVTGADYVPILYRERTLPIEAFQGRDVYFLDCAYDRSTMQDIAIVSKSLVVLDHHKTAIAAIGNEPYFKGNFEQSGAMLTWHYFFPDRPVPLLVYHIDDNDRWVHKDPYSTAFMERVRTFPKTFEAWSTLYQEIGTDKTTDAYQNFIKEGLVLLEALKMKSEVYAGQAFPIKLSGHSGLAVCCNRFFESTLGDIVSQRSNFACIFYFVDANTVSISLRSTGYDVEQIATKYGGGGHHKAAGFSISRSKWMDILAGDEELNNFFQGLTPLFDCVQKEFLLLSSSEQTVACLSNMLNGALDAKYPQLTGANMMIYGSAFLASVDLDHLYLQPLTKMKARLAKLLGLPIFETTKRFYHKLFGYSVETSTNMSDFTVKELLSTFSSSQADVILRQAVDSNYIAHLPQPYKEFTMTVHHGDRKHSITFRN